MPEHVVFKIPIIIETRASDGLVKYFCEQCQSLTEWSQPAEKPGEAVWHSCAGNPCVLHKEHLGIETKEDGTARFYCEKCEGWTQWIIPPSGPGGKVVHSCKEKIKIQTVDGNQVRVQEGCAGGHLSHAVFHLQNVIDKANSPELKAWGLSVLERFAEAREIQSTETIQTGRPPCIVGDITNARVSFQQIVKNSVSPEARAWAEKMLAQFEIAPELDVIEQAARANLETFAPIK